jgi:hypothetical protein
VKKNLGGFGTLLVLGLGLGLLRGGAPSAENARSAKAAGAIVQQLALETGPRTNASAANDRKFYCPEKDLLDTIDSFTALPGSVDELCKTQDPLQNAFQQLAQSGSEIKVVIATVPDPRHTHLSLFFDRTIDAIQQAAQEAGWIFDRANMPWESQEHPESTDFRVREQQKEFEDAKEGLPGLMIFRQAAPQDLNTSLFVFVVGETPTGGVSRSQFETAVKTITTIAAENHSVEKSALRIIGPTFSGSLYSLARLLNGPLSQKIFNGIVIRSGTVSSYNTVAWFTQCFPNPQQVDFATFQQSDKYMLRRFLEFEKRRGYLPSKIAVLGEDETAYGNRVASNPSSASSKKNEGPCPARDDAADTAKDSSEVNFKQYEDSVLQLYFPRDISQLRSAYQQGLQSQTSSSSDTYQIRSTLPLNLQDTGSDDDSVQRYAHSQTPLSQESILLGIIATIRKHHIEFVVLQATNPMDTVFLSGFLKKGYSQARVVAMPADLLLSRDADDVSLLHGVMALSTYSLLPAEDQQVAIAHFPQEQSNADHIFPSAYSAGTYNAVLSQITCIQSPASPGCVEGSQNLPEARYTEYGWPVLGGPHDSTNSQTPVVWLEVLGRDGFWPLAILDDGSHPAGAVGPSARAVTDASSESSAHAPLPKFEPPWPLMWSIMCGFVLALIGFYYALLRKGTIMASSAAMTLLAPVKDPCRSALIAIVGWLLLLAVLMLTWPWARWWNQGFLPITCLIVAIIATAFVWRTCVTQLKSRGSFRGAGVFSLVSAVLTASFLVLYIVPGHSQNPFLYRYIHLTSGVSPFLPFICLLAGGLWWAWFSLSGLTLVDKRRPQLPADQDLPHISTPEHTAAAVTNPMWPSERLAARLVDLARPCTRVPRVHVAAIFLLIVTLMALNYDHPLLSLETGHYEWAYAVALAAVAFSLLGTVFRLLVIWLECRRILVVLDHFPLRRAFGELNFTWGPFWRVGGGRWQDLYRLVSRQLETLEHLKREVESGELTQESQDLISRIGETAAAQDKIRRDFAQVNGVHDTKRCSPEPPLSNLMATVVQRETPPGRDSPEFSDYFIDRYRDLQKQLARTCAAALKYLQPKWWDEEGLIICEVASGDNAKKDDDDPKLSLSTRLAERFVALVYLNFILSIILRLRTLAFAAGGLYIFLLLSVNSYPFEPKVSLRSGAIFLLIFVVGVVGYVTAQGHRDSILSLVTQTKPGELGIEFWLRMGSFVALPLISLLVSQFPSLNNALFSWLEPAANALK